MLCQLTIRNYAIVDALDMDFRSGMSVITGETGAGKSIILGALGLTLGDRADKSVLAGKSEKAQIGEKGEKAEKAQIAEKAEISAVFAVADNVSARRWLTDHDLISAPEDAEHCLIRRVINADGRSKAYINGSPVTLANLTEFGQKLIDIHSQHEHQSLLRKSTHQQLLDEFGVSKKLLDDLSGCWQSWDDNRIKIKHLQQGSEELTAQAQLIAYQVNELDELNPLAGESEELEAEFQRLNNADDSLAKLSQALQLCRGDEGRGDEGEAGEDIAQLLSKAQAIAVTLAAADPQFNSALELLNSASIQVDEAASELQRYQDKVEINPEKLEWVNQRLADLHRVARKHKVKPAELSLLHESLAMQLHSLQNSDLELERLRQLDKELRASYQALADALSQQRRQAARKLSGQINKQLKDLGMSDARLEVTLQPVARVEPRSNGQENIEFLVSTNPGQGVKPLIKIASGGELSRISLAIQVITAKTSRIPSLVFDEVDVGIGGGVAKAVGRLLRQLAGHTQILCVTHQAQVASQGHQHYFVSKQSSGNATATAITELSEQQKVKEIARMLGGEEYSEESLAHAEQMVANS